MSELLAVLDRYAEFHVRPRPPHQTASMNAELRRLASLMEPAAVIQLQEQREIAQNRATSGRLQYGVLLSGTGTSLSYSEAVQRTWLYWERYAEAAQYVLEQVRISD